jgi:hypothetical protein
MPVILGSKSGYFSRSHRIVGFDYNRIMAPQRPRCA